MTILILFHQLRYRQFKLFYCCHMLGLMTREFPTLPSYSRFIELVPRSILPLCSYLQSMMEDCTGISYIDSTKLAVCHNKRIYHHKVFEGLAARGKSSLGWFYGFKLHAIINHKGELLSIKVTAGNTDDRVPFKDMVTPLLGKLFGDRGYISQALGVWLTKNSNMTLITKRRRNMKSKPLEPVDEALLKHRALIETVFGELKNLRQIEHSRHRSVTGFVTNLLSGLIAYCWLPDKPTIKNIVPCGQVAKL